MNNKIWFVTIEGQVSGPLENEQVERLISDYNGSSKANIQIWGRGQNEWTTPDKWKKERPVVPISNPEYEEGHLWKAREDDSPEFALTYKELVHFLKDHNEIARLKLTHDDVVWKEVYGYPKLVELLNITRRNSARVPILGTLTFKTDQGESTVKVISISQGGLGLNGCKNVHISQRIEGSLDCPNLYSSFFITGEIVYVGPEGYAGFHFIGVPAELKSAIIEYINKFVVN